MNLGLTGPLNPLLSGNAALGARLPRSPPAVEREAAGRGSFVAAAGQAGRGGRGGSGAPEHPAATHPSSLLPARPPSLLPRPGRPPLYFPLLASRARAGSGGAGGRSCAVVPGDRSCPGATRPEGLRLPPAGAAACARSGWRPWRCARCRFPGYRFPTPRSGSWPARGAKGSERRSGLGIATAGERTRA